MKSAGCRGQQPQRPTPSPARPRGWAGGGEGGARPRPRLPRRGHAAGRRGRGRLPKPPSGAGEERGRCNFQDRRGKVGPRGAPQTPRGDPSQRGPLAPPQPGAAQLGLPSSGGSRAAGKRRGPNTPELSPSAPRSARPSAPPGAEAAGSRSSPGDSPSSLRLALQPLARCRSSFISTHHPPPFSSQLSFKSETRCSARSRHSRRRLLRRHHRLSRRGCCRRCGRAEEAAAGTSARGPPGYVVPGPRPALPVPGGLARQGSGCPCPRLPRREGVAARTLGGLSRSLSTREQRRGREKWNATLPSP